MPGMPLAHNLLSWMLQSIVIACVAAPLPIVFRLRHPRMQLHYCHAVLALCLALPFLQPWKISPLKGGFFAALSQHGPWLFGVLAAGIVLQLAWMSSGLLRVRRYRIGATPLYPVPEAMKAAAAITHADALFCVSEEATGPVMLGWLAPVVLLPTSVLAMDEEAQCGVACHELLHVQRGDWLVTLIEGLAGALLWFNPGAWLLLSEARLAREQIVDAESVRLTASPEPYIDALMAIAREHTWPNLAAAPSFLRRSHLTQRMQLLLSDAPTSVARLAGSLCPIAGILGCSIWFACATFPILSGQPAAVPPAPIQAQSAAVPTQAVQGVVIGSVIGTPWMQQADAAPYVDPYEPVRGGVQSATSSQDRSAATALLDRARALALRHGPGAPPFRFTAAFVAGGNVAETGQGEISETWLTGRKWRWTASLGGVAHTRLMYRAELMEDHHLAVIPMRAHMLRNEVFWATRWFSPSAKLRTAKIMWQGNPATCVLGSEASATDGSASTVQGRLWEEEEYCVDDASAELVVHSVAPGTYAQFEYNSQSSFHGLRLPFRIRTYVAGALAIDATFQFTDPTTADDVSLTPQPGMTSDPKPVELGNAFRLRVDGAVTQPVIVHAELDREGKVVEAEFSAGTDAAALTQVRETNFGYSATERQAYVEVRPR